MNDVERAVMFEGWRLMIRSAEALTAGIEGGPQQLTECVFQTVKELCVGCQTLAFVLTPALGQHPSEVEKRILSMEREYKQLVDRMSGGKASEAA